MSFLITPVADADAAEAVEFIREEVFGREYRLQVLVLRKYRPADSLTLLARTESDGTPAATLTVVDTTADSALHRQMGLWFPERARVARYTQMAVLKPYRGLNLPLQLMLEARRLFIIPNNFEYSWFVFHAERAKNSCFAKMLGYKAGARTFQTDYGCTRVLVREEATPFTGRLDNRHEAHGGSQPSLPFTSVATTAA